MQLDGWVEGYNTERPHQGIGMVPPFERLRLAVTEPAMPTTSITRPIRDGLAKGE